MEKVKTKSRCSECGWTGAASDLNPIGNVLDRVAPGELMPLGECPDCCCLVDVPDVDMPQYTLDICAEIAAKRGETADSRQFREGLILDQLMRRIAANGKAAAARAESVRNDDIPAIALDCWICEELTRAADALGYELDSIPAESYLHTRAWEYLTRRFNLHTEGYITDSTGNLRNVEA